MLYSSPAYRDAPFAVMTVPGPDGVVHHLIWGHGWGQSSAALLPLAETLRPFASSVLIDFPGFGKTELPPAAWGTAEYADQVAGWLRSLPMEKFVWVGHSFGGRVGLQLASRHSDLVSGMVLIAAAGLQRQRTALQQARMNLRKAALQTAKRFIPDGMLLEGLRRQMGSADYRTAGALRPVFTQVVAEDLTEVAQAVRCPTLLLYGKNDTETPPEIGERLRSLIPQSELVVFENLGHLDILSAGLQPVAARIRKFLESLPR